MSVERTKAKDLARGKWASVLAALNIAPADVFETRKHHPCPKDQSGVDRFRFADRDGTGSYFCGCSNGDKGGMNLIMCCKGLGYADAAREVERVVGAATATPPVEKRDPRKKLNAVHRAAKRAGPAVRDYLAGRGLECPPCLKQVRERYYDTKGVCTGEFEAMAARVIGADGTPQTYHLTYLDAGRKADVLSPRKVLTPVQTINGAAVRLYPADAHLGIAEGIETAIAAHMLYGIPVWSVLNRNGIDTFVPPEGTEELTIFADNDSSFVGQASAFGAAKRLTARPHGIRCNVLVPNIPDTDWNDELLAQERAA